MAQCKTCHKEIQWGQDTKSNRWIPLEPVETDSDLAKAFVDTNGVLRADHRERCHGSSVQVTRLKKKVPADLPVEQEMKSRTKKTLKEKICGPVRAGAS